MRTWRLLAGYARLSTAVSYRAENPQAAYHTLLIHVKRLETPQISGNALLMIKGAGALKSFTATGRNPKADGVNQRDLIVPKGIASRAQRMDP